MRWSEKQVSQTNRCSLAVVFTRRRRLLVLGPSRTAPFLGRLGACWLRGTRGLGLVLIIAARSLATPIRAAFALPGSDSTTNTSSSMSSSSPSWNVPLNARWNWNRLRAYQPAREAPLLADAQLLVLVRLHPHLAAKHAALVAPRWHGPTLGE